MIIKRKFLGELLLNAGLITEQQLKAAEDEQKLTNRKLGEILKEKEYITEKQLTEIDHAKVSFHL